MNCIFQWIVLHFDIWNYMGEVHGNNGRVGGEESEESESLPEYLEK